MPKAVVPRELAKRDADEAIDCYMSENAPEAALGFIDALERAYSHIGRHPSAGFSRYIHELNLLAYVSGRCRSIHIWSSTSKRMTTLMFGAYFMASATFQHGCENPRNKRYLVGLSSAIRTFVAKC